jgi:hypothetical protein
MTVSWRRSASLPSDLPPSPGAAAVGRAVASTSIAATALSASASAIDLWASLGMALRMRSRWPALDTPMSFSS